MKPPSRRDIPRRTAYSGLLLATMLVLGYVESLLPPVHSEQCRIQDLKA